MFCIPHFCFLLSCFFALFALFIFSYFFYCLCPARGAVSAPAAAPAAVPGSRPASAASAFGPAHSPPPAAPLSPASSCAPGVFLFSFIAVVIFCVCMSLCVLFF